MPLGAGLTLTVMLHLAGCIAPSERLKFPAPFSTTPAERRYDVNADGRVDFSLAADDTGRIDLLRYDDDQDGTPDRTYRLSDYDPESVPHLIILFDSIPFSLADEAWRSGGWTWFDEPTKVIPPFPTMSPVIFSRLLGAPPLGGAINEYYDRARGKRVSRVQERTFGAVNPWERRLHYRLRYWENGLSFLDPRRWFAVELARAKAAFDASPDRVTLVYFASTAGMLSQYDAEGARECLAGLEQLCVQVMHERCGAVKISALADHGHVLRPGQRIDLGSMLREAGFHPANRLREDRDVVIEQDGLVNYAGIHTRRAVDVAAALAARPEIELAIRLDGERVVVRDARGEAGVEHRDGRLRYTPLTADVLDLAAVTDQLRAAGRADAEGFVPPQDWLAATADHQWPDAPTRLWEAFHGMVVSTPDVMVTTRPGFYVGLASFDWWIDMASTHGGLSQEDSATFLLTMTGRASGPLRTEDVMKTIEPTYDPSRLRR